jgi:hypothetical protein
VLLALRALSEIRVAISQPSGLRIATVAMGMGLTLWDVNSCGGGMHFLNKEGLHHPCALSHALEDAIHLKDAVTEDDLLGFGPLSNQFHVIFHLCSQVGFVELHT